MRRITLVFNNAFESNSIGIGSGESSEYCNNVGWIIRIASETERFWNMIIFDMISSGVKLKNFNRFDLFIKL
ncbi:hypothetical protein WICMUC_003619 [Wickerhamomyces mucosus]|uniref:Uncharacterized protein n=1 Tax=Wickerhamomyces mucosus TaxID=1378264 RepID=A0A9P8PJN8_9ASCO|nr:hypothetical protein WICMUC_003619 [Wickerhamomyces mucosus]